MDLFDFTAEDLYFDEPSQAGVDELIRQAAEDYGSAESECCLLKAYFIQPGNLSVLVALYRNYFYQQRLHEALIVADRALKEVGRRLNLSGDWRTLNDDDAEIAGLQSISLLRFYLFTLKGAGYLRLRLGDAQEALDCLNKVADLDTNDRMNVAELIRIAKKSVAEKALQGCAA